VYRYRRLPLDVFLHCTLGGFAQERKQLRDGRRWTLDEERYLIANYHRFNVRVIAKHINRSVATCYTRANVIGLSNNAERPWTDAEVERLIYLRFGRCQTTRGIMRELNRTYYAVKRKLSMLNQERKLAA
jgi:hypothetical protein